MIPQTTKQSLELYIKHGCVPGGFLEAVLSNDLFDAVGRADEENKKALPELVSYIYNNVSSECWGSSDTVNNWLAKFY